MMRAFVREGFGAVSDAGIAEIAKPDFHADDLLVRIAAASLNPSDWKEIEGNLVDFYPPYPARWVPGHDGAGIVAAAGENVKGLAPGDRVVFLAARQTGTQSGTLAEYTRVDQGFVAKAPGSISLAAAATIPTAGITAYQALFRPDVGAATAGLSVLVHGSSGGLGSFAVAMSKSRGLRVAATCRAANADYVRDLGAEIAIDYAAEDVVAATRRWAPDGVEIVLDVFSGGQQRALLDALAPGGRLVVIATVTEDGDIAALTAEATARGFSVYFFVMKTSTLATDLTSVAEMIDRHGMKMPEINAFTLDQAGDALAAMQAGKVRGKIVVNIAELD